MRPIHRIAGLLICAVLPGCGKRDRGRSELVQPAEWWRVHPRPVYAALDKVGTFQDWFDVYRLAEDTYAIYEPNQFEEALSYLVLGRERGVLIDAGTGIGSIRDVVSELTELPLSVVLTHEHYDHVGGAFHFEEIAAYDNATALGVLKRGRDNASLVRYVTPEYLWKPVPTGWDPTHWMIPSIEPTTLLHDGDRIDLGGRSLEIVYTPGHSPGSMALLDRDRRILFTGDHFYPGPLYAHEPDVDLDQYLASNDRLAARAGEYDHVCSGHNDPWVAGSVIPRVSDAFRVVLGGEGEFSEDDGLRRYRFDGFDILIRADAVIRRSNKPGA